MMRGNKYFFQIFRYRILRTCMYVFQKNLRMYSGIRCKALDSNGMNTVLNITNAAPRMVKVSGEVPVDTV